MNDPNKKLESLGYPLDDAPAPGGVYKPVTVIGSIAYVSGAVPVARGRLQYAGKVPSDLDLPAAQRAAGLCAANNLRMIYQELGSLDRIARVLRLTGFVNSEPDFTDQHLVINGASELLKEIFGDLGIGARSAVGMTQLPLGSAVETELILEIHS
ncbi:MAG: RidA family protein [Bacteroidetes bacterium]|nr:RidA family protein [Bacteroidota bacterium]MCY4205849.1 RidA family protein [Bacteroidota bacterium]